MQFISSLSGIPADFGPSAVTVGKFDGVHTGHRSVLEALRELAADRGLVPTVLTFDRNPLSLLDPESCPAPLVSNEQKRELLAATGIDTMVMLPFDRRFSEQSAEQFVRSVLVDALHAKIVFVGPDFRFGEHGNGDVAMLAAAGARLGFEVRSVEAMKSGGQRRVSSTWIRRLLSEGKVAAAARLLGRAPAVRGVVVRGEQRGRALGYPTANLSPELEGFIPADGVYAGWLTVDGRTLPAAASVGNNPTFDGVPDQRVEAHVLDTELDLYDKTVELSFVEWIRGMEKFDSVDDLVARMRQDEVRARRVLGDAPGK